MCVCVCVGGEHFTTQNNSTKEYFAPVCKTAVSKLLHSPLGTLLTSEVPPLCWSGDVSGLVGGTGCYWAGTGMFGRVGGAL